jgi:chorismate mutase
VSDKNIFYLVNGDILPDVYRQVVKAKRLLATGQAATINEAIQMTGISRSTFYKYKDSVFSFSEGSRGKIITISLTLSDLPGVLSGILNRIAEVKGNVLTINQNIPIHDTANVTISVDTKQMEEGQETFINRISELPGVLKIEVIAQE